MLRTHTYSKTLILAMFAVLICLSPTLNLIPKKLIATSFHDSHRLLELIFISAILLYNSIPRPPAFAMSPTLRNAFYALIALAIASSLLALSPRHALIEISIFAGLSYLTIFVIRLHHENNTQLIQWLVYAYWAGIALSMVSFYVGYTTATIFASPIIWPAPVTGFGNIRFFNQYQLWTVGLITLPLLAYELKNNLLRRSLHVGLTAWWIILFFTSSRGVLLANLIGLLGTAIIYRKQAWSFIRLQLTHITTGFIGYITLFQLIPNLRGSGVIITGTVFRSTTSDRMRLWDLSMELIRNHPVFGIGPMHFAWYNNNISAHPHDSVLQLMTEWGLPAALIILSLAGYGLFCWIKKFNANTLSTQSKLQSNLIVILFFTLIANATYSLVDGVIVMPISQIMMFTSIGLAMAIYQTPPQISTRKNSLFLAVFAGLTLITLIGSSLPEILQGAKDNPKHFSMGYQASGPRFWEEVK
jgi:O-antigen ligase